MDIATRDLQQELQQALQQELQQDPEKQKRKEERVSTELPVYLGGAIGKTRDVSASGILFETDASCPLWSTISFAVELDISGGKMVLRCQGDIVRIEPRGKKVSVAVKITKSTLEPAKP